MSEDIVERLDERATYGYMPVKTRQALQDARSEIVALREQLAAVLDVADEAYRKYGGNEFDGFDEADVIALQTARNFWLDNGGYEKLAATAIAAGQHKGEQS